MKNNEIIYNICFGLFGVVLYIGFLLMFIRATWKGDFIFHGGRIRGKLAKIIGGFGLIGMAAGTYLLIGHVFFDTQPPFASTAWFLVGLMLVILFIVKTLALFMWH